MFQKGNRVLGGRYRIDDLAGEKKSCIVFKATRVSDDHPVAVRVLAPFVQRQPHVVSRLRSRAEFAMGMEHANLTQVYEVGEEEGSLAIVESWHEAMPLLRVVRGKGACSPYEAAWIAAQLARGVDHLISSGAPGFDFTLSDVYADIGELGRETEFFSMPVHQWPGLAIKISPLALDGDGFSERALATPTDSAQPLVRSVARIIFNLVTGGMGDPLSEPVLSEKFTASLRDCLTGARQAGTCRELLWTLFGDLGPEISALLPGTGSAREPADGEVGALLEDLDRQGEELEALLRYKSFGKQIKRQLAVLEEQRAGVIEQQRRMHDDGERLQALEERLRAERDQLAGQREELGRRGIELAEKERIADEAARARAAELREREVELESLHAEQERERAQVRAELERLRVSQEGLAHEKSALSERVARYESEQQELAASRGSLEAERKKLDSERDEIEGRVGEFKRLKEELERSEQDLEEKRRALAVRQTEIETKGVGLSSVERELSDRLAEEQKELEARIEAVQAKNRAIEDREEALRAKEASLISANQALVREEESLSGRLGEVDAKLAMEKGRLSDKEREIQSREETLAAKERDWQAKLAGQRSIQEEKERLVDELRGKLAGVSGELQAVTAEKQRLETERSRIAASQEALGERSVSIDRERVDLKVLEEKLRRELHEEGEGRSRENKALERRILIYRRFVRFGVPLAAAAIIGLAALLLAKPKFPESASAVQGLPEWKQEWLRKDLAEDIGRQVAAGEWRPALGSLHYYSLGFSRRPDAVMDAANRTCSALAEEFDAAPDAFKATITDTSGHDVPVAPALLELARWGIPDAGRIYHHLQAREALRQARVERSLRARADALRSIVALLRYYPADKVAWKSAVAPVLTPLIASSIDEAVKLLDPEKFGGELSEGFREVFSEEKVLQDLKELDDAGVQEAGALLVAAQALGVLVVSDTPDPARLAGFIADCFADPAASDWPAAIRESLASVLVAHVRRFRMKLKEGSGSFVDVLESRKPKPEEVTGLAANLWRHFEEDYPQDLFVKQQRRDFYMFIGDALTNHGAKGSDVVNMHPAYQRAANLGDEEGIYWSGRGHVGASLEDRQDGDTTTKVIANREAYDKGYKLLIEAAKSSRGEIKQEALWVLAETSLELHDLPESLKWGRQAFETGKNVRSALIYLETLLESYRKEPDTALAGELTGASLESARVARGMASSPGAGDLLDFVFRALARMQANGVVHGAEVLEEVTRQFDIASGKDDFAGLRYYHRSRWKYSGYPPFEALSKEEALRQYFEDNWESAQAHYQPAKLQAQADGLEWGNAKEDFVKKGIFIFRAREDP